MEKEQEVSRISGEDRISEKYTKRFGEPIRYTIGVTRYRIGSDGKRSIVWDVPKVSEKV